MRNLLIAVAVACVSTSAATTAAAANSSTGDLYRAECGSCHDAYPARLLGASDWRRVLTQLDRHYGVDASLDDATLRAVAQALGVDESHSTAHAVSAAALPRITTRAWFVDEHDEVNAATFRSPKVRSAANCSACHVDAARGEFDDDSIRMAR